ncbi:MAG: M23 family metallopeptidase [Desulfotomaculum sp.]|nr:M23 family metallopeptidase [Desulfotomaculum sp.]
MWPFNHNLKNKLRNQDALKKYQEWLKRWFLKGAKFYAAVFLVLLIGAAAAIRLVLFAPTENVLENREAKPSVTAETLEKHSNTNELNEQPGQKEKHQDQKPQPEKPDLSGIAMPVNGKVLLGFNQPYYSKTYDDYRFCSGLQLEAAPGEPVKAALAGKVVSADLDELSGFTVVIDHGDGCKTSYKGLNTVQAAVNQQVEKGGVIGAAKPDEKSKVQFTLTKDGVPVDPEKY